MKPAGGPSRSCRTSCSRQGRRGSRAGSSTGSWYQAAGAVAPWAWRATRCNSSRSSSAKPWSAALRASRASRAGSGSVRPSGAAARSASTGASERAPGGQSQGTGTSTAVKPSWRKPASSGSRAAASAGRPARA
ncbi:hypothetical protein WJ971_14515 [Achromobacter xylosoxidans]